MVAYRKKGELRSSQEEHNAPVRILPRILQYLKEGAKPFLHSEKGRSLSQWESAPTHPSVVDSDNTIETGQSTTLCRFLACRPLATTPMTLPLSSIPKRQSTSEELIRPLRISFRYGMFPDGRVTIALELRW
ncbi:hypothetical protein M9H77_30801 [Catharanthus roseus]|uniref:Uncharacterized protein n=1 Tax=Catharanthus roseus TaxID=4058 RepID=A0ACB9ZZ49_CATRO|nr:hypothetical protein M9H77_30801 [Catharanthus roseus]